MTSPHVRWLIRRDMPEVMEIENRSFDRPWDEEHLLTHLRERNCIGMVAEVDDDVLGYMVYELHKSRLMLLRLAVNPDYRRDGIGTAMISKLKSKLSQQRRSEIELVARESWLDSHLFFRSLGFVADGIACDHYDDGEDAIAFRFVLGAEPVKAHYKNRISAFYGDA